MHPTSRWIVAALLCATPSLLAQRQSLVGRPAPPLRVAEWFQLPEGQDTFRLDAHRGKVVYLYCFQSWCPGCHSHGFPTLKAMTEKYAEADDVVFAAVQTVFEGFESNTLARAKACAEKFALTIPFGHDVGDDGRLSNVLSEFDTGGTPWTILLDRDGIVRYADFGEDAAATAKRLDALRAAPALLGSSFGELPKLRALDGDEPVRFGDSPLTLLRWWTDTCPHCEASLPALDALARSTDGLRVVGVYHAKPKSKRIEDETVRAAAAAHGFAGPLLRDPNWQALHALQARGLPKVATSVSVLVDAAGTIRWFHEGPRIHAGLDGKHRAAERALDELKSVTGRLLLEKARSRPTSRPR